jgi:tetratricopeptide (TPR) repeat protein
LRPTVAHDILETELAAFSTVTGSTATLDLVVDAAVAAVRSKEAAMAKFAERERALQTLTTIEESLTAQGFVYPGRGYVSHLQWALTPVSVDVAGRRELMARGENKDRVSAIKARTPPVFLIADCDIYSIVYLAIAERLGLPLAMVNLPSLGDYVGHDYVTWTLADGTQVDWEADAGKVHPPGQDTIYFSSGPHSYEDARRSRAYAMPMTRNEVLGYATFVIGGWLSEMGSLDRAVAAWRRAIELSPGSPDAYNELAWLLATAPTPSVRAPTEAVRVAEQLEKLWPSANNLDTVAAAYASAGRWREAVATQGRAVEMARTEFWSRPEDFEQRQAYYLKCQPYFGARTEEAMARRWARRFRDRSWKGPLFAAPSAVEDPVKTPATPDACPGAITHDE